MNLVAWIMLYAYGVSLLVFNEIGGLTVDYKWKVLEDPSLSIKGDAEVLVLDFKDSESKKILKTFYLIPWNEIYENTVSSDAGLSIIPDVALICVTPNCVVYEKLIASELSESEMKKAKSIDEKIRQMLDAELYNQEKDYKEGYTLKGLQIINKREYTNYVELNIAVPGSDAVDYDKLTAMFPKKMIRLILQPDYGPVKIIWINSGNNALSKFLNKNELDFTQIIKDGIVKESNHVTQQDYYLYTLEKIENLVEKYKGSDEDLNYLKRLVTHLYHKKPDGRRTIYNDSKIFPDYQIKETPDITTDFRPSLREKILKLPDATIENLPELAVLYSKYFNQTKVNPGKWEDGNMILGAKSKEYIPSDAELLLCETGIKLQTIVEKYASKEIKAVLKRSKVHLRKIEFTKFTYTHCDVMGSGRFFYIETMNTVKMKLW